MKTPIAPLDQRVALPDGMAHLLPSYPKARWRAHAAFGPMTKRWLMMHDSPRESGGGLLQVAMAFRDTIGHTTGFYRSFRQLDTRMASGFDLLEGDHKVIHEALVQSAGGIDRLIHSLVSGDDAIRFALNDYLTNATRLHCLLERHLADEEQIVIPALLHHGESTFL